MNKLRVEQKRLPYRTQKFQLIDLYSNYISALALFFITVEFFVIVKMSLGLLKFVIIQNAGQYIYEKYRVDKNIG